MSSFVPCALLCVRRDRLGTAGGTAIGTGLSPRADSCAAVLQARTLRIGQGFRGIVLSSEAESVVSRADRELIQSHGVGGINCSWNRSVGQHQGFFLIAYGNRCTFDCYIFDPSSRLVVLAHTSVLSL
jgi:hypothetical protein